MTELQKIQKIQNVEQIIRDLAIENINLYRESYPNDDSDTASANIKILAENYWDNRSEHEIERDESLNIDINDYESWCANALQFVLEQENS